jgi:hypothetical protein
VYEEAELFHLNEAWHSWKHHSRFSAPAAGRSLQLINQSVQQAHNFLKEADFIIITLGSAWVYVLTELAAGTYRGRVAANNHKAPANWFNRRLLAVEEILAILDNLMHRLFLFNQKIRIIFTISPVRHLREGVVENNRSKAALIQAVHHLVDKFDRLYYFPAYELVIDDLRDYRFYAEDLVHPNYAATQYVWEKFVAASMELPTRKLIDELHAIHLAYTHKPFNAGSEQHKQFLRSFYGRATAVLQEHPYLDLASELEYFNTSAES